MKNYHIVKNGASAGPYSIEQLRFQNLLPETKVWYEGLPDWVEAKTLPELAPMFQPVMQFTPAPQPKSSIDWKLIIWLVVIIGVMGSVGTFFYNNSFNINDFSTEEQYLRKNWKRLVQVGIEHAEKKTDKGGFKSITIAVFNNMSQPIEEVKVELVYQMADGTPGNIDTLIFNNIGANKKVLLSAPDSFQGIKIEPNIFAIRCDAIKLNYQ